MYITGKIKRVYATQQVSEKFKKLEFVVTTTDKYPQHILMQFTQDNCLKLDNFKIGDEVKVSFGLRGREWISPTGEAKYFSQIEAWKIEKFVETATPKVESSGDVIDDQILPF